MDRLLRPFPTKSHSKRPRSHCESREAAGLIDHKLEEWPELRGARNGWWMVGDHGFDHEFCGFIGLLRHWGITIRNIQRCGNNQWLSWLTALKLGLSRDFLFFCYQNPTCPATIIANQQQSGLRRKLCRTSANHPVRMTSWRGSHYFGMFDQSLRRNCFFLDFILFYSCFSLTVMLDKLPMTLFFLHS